MSVSVEKAGFQKQIKDTVVLQNSVFFTNVRVGESSKVRQFQLILRKISKIVLLKTKLPSQRWCITCVTKVS